MQLIEYKKDTYVLIEEGKLSYLSQHSNFFMHLIPNSNFYYYPSLYYIKDNQFYFTYMDLMEMEELPTYWSKYQEYLKTTKNMISYEDFLDL